MIKFDNDWGKENIKKDNPNWPQLTDHPHWTLITEDFGS